MEVRCVIEPFLTYRCRSSGDLGYSSMGILLGAHKIWFACQPARADVLSLGGAVDLPCRPGGTQVGGDPARGPISRDWPVDIDHAARADPASHERDAAASTSGSGQAPGGDVIRALPGDRRAAECRHAVRPRVETE